MFYKVVPRKKARHEECICCTKRIEKLSEKNKRRRIMRKKSRKPNISRHSNYVIFKKPKMSISMAKVYEAKSSHSFFQYNALIYSYLKKEKNLSFGEVNLLMMLHPIQPFFRADLHTCRRIIEFKDVGVLPKFLKMDLIEKWGVKVKRIDLFQFTEKGHELVNDIYLWATSNKELPVVESKKTMDIMSDLRGLGVKRK